jgi:peptidoglycan/LPS O-acetylase OafA/YrhL
MQGDTTLKPSDTYRPDIDGLRAVSVIAVVLFHAGMGVTGGFVGVDVFFVISGFLITSLVLKQQDAGKFDVVEFFARRIRRIIPAVCVMTLATLILGWPWLSPAAWVDLAQSALAQVVMMGSVWYWRTISYFSTEAELKPLLHMWSLAVEEQFYLAYPFALVALKGCSRRTLLVVLSTIAIVSLVLSEFFLTRRASAVYYLLPFRSWELLLGGIIALLPRRRTSSWAEIEVAAGLGLILLTAVFYDSKTRFPGLGAVPPCVGAAMVIDGGRVGTTAVGRLLSSRPMVGIGLLSYSLYLWHWPFLALSRNLLGPRLPWPIAATSIVLAVAAAVASWRWVEEPIRRGRSFSSPRSSARLFLGAAGVTMALSAVILVGRGFPERFSPTTLGYFEARSDKPFRANVPIDAVERGELPAFGEADGRDCVVVWGDSHAMMIVPGVDAACSGRGVIGLQATHSSTPPVLDFVVSSRYGLNAEGPRFNRAVLKEILDRRPGLVILGGYWRTYATRPDFEGALRQTVDAVTSAGIPLCLVLDTAEFASPVPEALARRSVFGQRTTDVVMTAADYEDRNGPTNAVLQRVAKDRAIVLDPAEVLTDASGDWAAQIDGQALYHDAHHLTGAGARRLAPQFLRLFRELGLGSSVDR